MAALVHSVALAVVGAVVVSPLMSTVRVGTVEVPAALMTNAKERPIRGEPESWITLEFQSTVIAPSEVMVATRLSSRIGMAYLPLCPGRAFDIAAAGEAVGAEPGQ